jgi:hypothetical protein
MTSHTSSLPRFDSHTLTRAIDRFAPGLADRAKRYLPDHPLATKAVDYAKAHPGKAAIAAVGALWLAKKIFR